MDFISAAWVSQVCTLYSKWIAFGTMPIDSATKHKKRELCRIFWRSIILCYSKRFSDVQQTIFTFMAFDKNNYHMLQLVIIFLLYIFDFNIQVLILVGSKVCSWKCQFDDSKYTQKCIFTSPKTLLWFIHKIYNVCYWQAII